MKTRLSLLMAVSLLTLLLMTIWPRLASGSVLAGLAADESPTATIVGGSIITDTTWTRAGSPYILQTQNVTVMDNVTLTIEAGVTVELDAGIPLREVKSVAHAVDIRNILAMTGDPLTWWLVWKRQISRELDASTP